MLNMDPSRETVAYMVRHGELHDMSVWDGWSDMDLSAEGCQQAEKAALWLSFERIGRVVSSDVPRAAHTAQYLMDTGCVVCPYITFEPNLRPRMVAGFTGLEKTPARVAEFKKYIDDPSLVIPGGESGNQLEQRIQVIWQYVMTPYDAKPTAFFMHNSVMKALMGLEDVKEIVEPGGIVAILMDEKGALSFEVVLGAVPLEKGVNG